MNYLLYIIFMIVGCATYSPYDTVIINTPTTQCDMCKKTIESNLLSAKGVNSAVVDMINFKTVIQYDSNMVSLKELELVIAKSGYQANEVKADSIAYENIPMCCRLANDRSE